jgi:glyoxylase-like metal-dependent hydrolase (beta-lactamase superfamily II)
VGAVNTYLIEGDPLTLIDCGPKYPDALNALESELAKLRYRIEDIQRVIVTHHHIDHIGLAGEIVKRSNASIISHKLTAPYLIDYEKHRSQGRDFYQQLLTESGVPEWIKEKIDRVGSSFARWVEPVAAVTLTIGEGDTINIGGSSWRVYHTPGHAGDLICFFNEVTGELLSNDHLLRDISSNPLIEAPLNGETERPKRLLEYITHMKRIAELNPRIAYPGHGEIIEDVPDLVRKRLHFHQRRANKIYEMLQPIPLTLWELTDSTFKDRLKTGSDFFLGLSEILGHVDILVEEGRVTSIKEGDVIKWEVI